MVCMQCSSIQFTAQKRCFKQSSYIQHISASILHMQMHTIWFPLFLRPIIVFDGEKLPAKAKEDQRRNQVREESRLKALELMQRKEPNHLAELWRRVSRADESLRFAHMLLERFWVGMLEWQHMSCIGCSIVFDGSGAEPSDAFRSPVKPWRSEKWPASDQPSRQSDRQRGRRCLLLWYEALML